MKKIITAIAAGALTLSMAACNTPGERAVGGAAIGGLAGAAIGGAATGSGRRRSRGRGDRRCRRRDRRRRDGSARPGLPLRHLSGRLRQRLLPLIAADIANFRGRDHSRPFSFGRASATTERTDDLIDLG